MIFLLNGLDYWLFYFSSVVVEVYIEFLTLLAGNRIVAAHVLSPVVRDVAVAPVEVALIESELCAPPVETRHLDACAELAAGKEGRRYPLSRSIGRSCKLSCSVMSPCNLRHNSTDDVSLARINSEGRLNLVVLNRNVHKQNIPSAVGHLYADAYYLVGDMCGWAADAAIKFSHSGADVYEDPVFSVVFTTPKADCYWKIVPQGNIDSGDLWHEGTDGVVGVAIDGDPSLTGSLVTTAPKAGKIEKQGFYKLTVNMMDYTYTIEEMAGEYYMVGDLQGWNNDPATGMTCLFYPQTSTVMSYTTKWKGAYDLKFWAGADFGNWDKAYGCAVDGDNSPAGNIVNSGAQSISAPSAEYYTFTIDMTTMKYTWTKLSDQAPKEYISISLIGDFNSWSGDVDLTQVTPHNWYAKVSIPSDGGLKFRAGHDWADSWGNGANIADNYYGKADYNGGNMTVPAGTYSVYFNDITTEFVFLAE